MIAERLFRALMRLLPFEFRADYGGELERTFREQRREARGMGRASVARVWWINIRDILRTAPREHLADLLQDAGYALRGMRRRPGFAAIVIITLALGTGASTAMFAVAYTVLMRPLPYAHEEALVRVWNKWAGSARAPLSDPEYLDYAERTQTMDLAALAVASVNVADRTEPEQLPVCYATPNVFAVLGVSPILGRGFESEDASVRKGQVAVLTYALWQRRFADEPGILGSAILIDGVPYVVVGVTPPAFRMPSDFGAEQRCAIVLPLVLDPSKPRNRRGGHYLATIARLKPGVTVQVARAELSAIVEGLIREYPDQHNQGGFGIVVHPARTDLVGEARPVLLVLLGAVGLVLLIACANVTNLILARGEVRRPELAVRTALGGSRYRLVRQLVTENCILFLAGSSAGLIAAYWVTRGALAIDPATLPRVDEVGIRLPAVLFALLSGLVGGMVFGALPAIQSSRVRVAECLADATRGGSGAQRSRIRRALVAAQVGLSLVLLIAAGLLVKSFVRLGRVQAGFQPKNVLTLRLSLPEARYPEKPEITTFYRELLDHLRSLPGVGQAGASSGLPLSVPSGDWGFDVEGRPVGPRHEAAADWFAVTPGYFETMGIRLVEGRFPDRTDVEGAEPVIFLNETAARTVFPRGGAVGQRIRLGGQVPQPWYRIAGIVGDVRHRGLASSPIPEMYIPHDQFRHFMPRSQARAMTVVIKAAVVPTSLTDAVRREVRRLDPEIALSQVRTMDEVTSSSVADRRLQLALVGAFALLALVLAIVGIYGVMSYHLSERKRELGIRMALGASASDVLVEVVASGMRLVCFGILCGGAAAYLFSGSMERLLFDVSPTDWTIFAALALLLAAAGLLSCYLPARRASRLVPNEALLERGF